MPKIITDIEFICGVIAGAEARALDFLKSGDIVIDVKLEDGENIFHPIALENTERHHQFLQEMLEIVKQKGYLPKLLNTQDEAGFFPIYRAIQKENFVAADMMIRYGAIYNKNAIDNFLTKQFSTRWDAQVLDNFDSWRMKEAIQEQKSRYQPAKKITNPANKDKEKSDDWTTKGVQFFQYLTSTFTSAVGDSNTQTQEADMLLLGKSKTD